MGDNKFESTDSARDSISIENGSGGSHIKGNRHMANIFHGNFPTNNSNDDGYFGLAPCTAFGRQNGFNLYNMIGNAWEWVHDDRTTIHTTTTTRNIKNTGEDDYNDDNDDNEF